MKYILRNVFNFFVAAATTAPHTVAPEWESPWPHLTMLATKNSSQNVAITRKLRKFLKTGHEIHICTCKRERERSGDVLLPGVEAGFFRKAIERFRDPLPPPPVLQHHTDVFRRRPQGALALN